MLSGSCVRRISLEYLSRSSASRLEGISYEDLIFCDNLISRTVFPPLPFISSIGNVVRVYFSHVLHSHLKKCTNLRMGGTVSQSRFISGS